VINNKTNRGQDINPLGLPRVTGVEVSLVNLSPPRQFYYRGRLVAHNRAVQLLVRTSGPLPVRDVTPVIFIGDVQVAQYRRVGVNLYRFFIYDVEKLRPGAPIAFGWPFAPQAKIPTDFRFNLTPPPLA
jgi:hypothetical protein